ncbi:MAG: DUF6776 family protein [Pseudomonadota bacterium]
MKLTKHLHATFGAHAQKVTIRPQVPWYWRGTVLILFFSLVAGLLWWFFDGEHRLAGFDQIMAKSQFTETKEVAKQLSVENLQIKSKLNTLYQQVEIEHAAQAELSKNVSQLQDENARLKEEISFFRSITSSSRVPEGLNVQNFRVEPDILPNEYRFHVLVVQGGRGDRSFVGKAQLIANVQKNGVAKVLTLPDDEKSAPAFDINLKYYQRLEGRFKVESGMVVKSVQLRITEKATGQVRLIRSLSLS